MLRFPVLAVLLLSSPALAVADGSGAPTQAGPVEEVLRTYRNHDAGRMKELAAFTDPDPWDVADGLIQTDLADAREAAAAFAKAVPGDVGEALGAYVASHKDRPDAREVAGAFGEALGALADGHPQSALQLLDSVSPPAGSTLAVRMLALRAHVLRSMKRHVDSGAAGVKTADAAEAIGWRTAAVDALKLAEIQSAKAFDWDAGKLRCQRLQALQERMGDVVGAARTLSDRGTMAVKQANFPEALRFYEEARRVLEAAGDAADALTTRGDEGAVHAMMGEYPLALSIQHRVLDALLAAADDPEGIADTYDRLGTLQMDTGDAKAARSHYETAIERYRLAKIPDGEARTLGNLGILECETGDLDAALGHMKEAQRIFEGEDDLEALAQIQQCTAEVLLRRKETDRALVLLGSALHAEEELGNAELAAYARSSMGDAYRDEKRFPEALAAYDKALAESQRLLLRKLRVDVLAGVAKTQLEAGNLREASRAARDAVADLAKLTIGYSESQGIGARGRATDVCEAGALAALGSNDVDDLAYFLEAGRAGQFLAALGGRFAIGRATVSPALEKAGEDAGRRAAQALAKYREAHEAGVLADMRERWLAYEKERAAAAEAEDRIQADAARLADALFPRLDSLADMRRNLPDGTALVLYALLPGEAVAVVATRQEAHLARLGRTADLEAAIAPLRFVDASIDAGPALAAAKKALLDPLRLDASVRRLLVSPDGAVGLAPIAALAGDRDAVFVPSGTAYGLLLADRMQKGKGVLALGDPDYATKRSAEAIEMRRGGADLLPLPHSRDEVQAIARAKDDVTLLGKDASVPGLLKALAASPARRWRAVHFACHGHVDVERPLLSSLALTATDGDDGFLTGVQLFRLKIPADLAVLSACETGRGPVVRGEGLVALTRAFMFAGAPRVLVSLWDVDDEATVALMTRFYAAWNSGKVPAAALREAQGYVRAQPKWSHPYYWAAWVLWGLPE